MTDGEMRKAMAQVPALIDPPGLDGQRIRAALRLMCEVLTALVKERAPDGPDEAAP